MEQAAAAAVWRQDKTSAGAVPAWGHQSRQLCVGESTEQCSAGCWPSGCMSACIDWYGKAHTASHHTHTHTSPGL